MNKFIIIIIIIGFSFCESVLIDKVEVEGLIRLKKEDVWYPRNPQDRVFTAVL